MEITNISNINSTEFTNQDYNSKDEKLLNSLVISQEFGLPEDKVEIHIVSPNGELLNSIYDFRNYTTRNTIEGTPLYSNIELDPKKDLESFGYFIGQYDITYYFYRQLFGSSEAAKFFISEISSDRTEIKLSTNNISYNDLGKAYLDFITIRNSRAFYTDFLINAGDNKTYIGVNIAFDNVNIALPSLYIKLYEPLPSSFSLKDNFWLVENISEPYSFKVNTEFIAEKVSDSIPLRGPNISIELAEKSNLTTNYLNLSNLLSSSTTSSFQQLQSWMEEKSIEISVDYNDFNNFTHFSSAQDRLENFKYKLSQIQSLESDLNSLDGLNPITSQGYINVNKNNLQTKIDLIIEKFDGYEYFLYYESGSNSWPKLNSEKPYINDIPTSIASKTWLGSTIETSQYYGGKLLEANIYDNLNKDYTWNNLPEYIKEDSQNANLELFVSMMGQHYDNIWVYIKDITNLQVADNRIDHGISKDLVADTLRNFGIKLYTNSRGQDDLYMSLLGINSNYGTLHSTGSYIINNYVTASAYTISDNDIVKETYKRIYHNLPYLLKTKGTKRGLRALINCFGIPETILKVKEFGGNKKDLNIIEQFNEKFNYSLDRPQLEIPFDSSEKQFLDTGNVIFPDTLEFRFKLDNIVPTQSLLETQDSWKHIRVIHTTGSYANIDFGLSNDNTFIYSTPIELPLYNEDWWTLNLTRETGSIDISQIGLNQTYTLTIGNKDTKKIQYFNSTSININGSTQSSYNLYGWNTENNIIFPFSGSIQEFRYWINSIPENNFKDHILNPQSIVNNGVTGSYDNLIFRLPLGSELDTNLNPILSSVHPSPTSSFIGGSTGSLNGGTYIINNELFLVNTPNIGTITEIDEKVRIANPNLVPGGVLTPFISIQKPESIPYTPDLSIVEVAISPQDSINEDIISQLGSFNIDEYIGDPRLNSSNTYPSLNELRDFYFKKYSDSQNVFDIIKLLSYFDNSLFKMIKDFVPARTNLSTGLVIKSHILERNKIARHEPILEYIQYSGSIETAFISGSNGLNLDSDTTNTITTTYISGSTPKIITDRRELLNGEFGGTTILIHSQSLDNIVYEANHMHLSGSQTLNQNFKKIALNPTLNNVYLPRTSPKYIDIDYAYNPITPVNFNFLTASLFSNLSSSNFPFLRAGVQDSNYSLKRHTNPRYNGSKLSGALYNTYTVGDKSYGKDPVIDLNSVKFAYFKEITSQSLTLNGRSNINIKYLIDSASNIVELTEANQNIFDVQRLFNKTNANIALENINQPSNQKSLNGSKTIYSGGYRYEPILQNYSTLNTLWSSLEFKYYEDISIPNPSPGGQVTSSLNQPLTIGTYQLSNPLNHSTPNTSLNDIIVSISTGINFNVTRNTPTDIELRQRITGILKLIIKLSPSNLSSTLYNRYVSPSSQTGLYTWENIPPGNYEYNDNKIQPSWNNNIQSVKLPSGVTGYFYEHANSNTLLNTIIGNNTRVNVNGYDISSFTLVSDNTNVIFTTSSAGNSFQTSNLVSLNINTGTYSVEGEDSLIVEATFPFDGLIVLPKGTISGILPLLTLSENVGLLNQNYFFSKTSTSPQIELKSPILTVSPQTPEFAFSYIQAPDKLYITGSSDNGFNSGATAKGNWYFERGNSINFDNKFLSLTASENLSKLYYDHYDPNGIYYGNPIQQVLPNDLIGLGYQPITEYFNPKKGDLIKFFDKDSNKFPYATTFEREIINIYPPSQIPGTGANGIGSYEGRLVFEVNDTISDPFGLPQQICNNTPSDTVIGQVLDFIFLTKIPDETNVIINSEKKEGQTSPGIIFPTNIIKSLKEESGNIIKKLKSQNLI